MTATTTSESPTAVELQGAVPIGSGDLLGRIVCGDNVEVLSGFPYENMG
jgi:hypothetical protein